MIVVAITCIVLAVVITFVTNDGGGSRRQTGPIHMLCVNPDCGEKSAYRGLLSAQNAMRLSSRAKPATDNFQTDAPSVTTVQ
jgi:hypothetical protein